MKIEGNSRNRTYGGLCQTRSYQQDILQLPHFGLTAISAITLVELASYSFASSTCICRLLFGVGDQPT